MTQHLNPQQRNEVVSLILSLSPNSNIGSGDLAQIRNEIESLSTQVDALRGTTSQLAESVAGHTEDIGALTVQCGQLTADFTSLTLRVLHLEDLSSSHDSAISKLTALVTQQQASLSNLSTQLASLTTSVDNLTTGLNELSVKLLAVEDRLTKVEAASTIVSVESPLMLSDGRLSVSVDPNFASTTPSLRSYSAPAQFGSGEWLINAGSYSSNSAYQVNVIAHSHGTRTSLWLSSTTNFTLNHKEMYIKCDTTRMMTWPLTDQYRLNPSEAFRHANFPFELIYKHNSGVTTYSGFAKATAPTIIEMRIPTALQTPTNVQILSLTYSIDI